MGRLFDFNGGEERAKKTPIGDHSHRKFGPLKPSITLDRQEKASLLVVLPFVVYVSPTFCAGVFFNVELAFYW